MSICGDYPFTVKFSNLSIGTIDSYSWDFGDGSATSALAEPTHTYALPGSYTPILTATRLGVSVTYSLAVVNVYGRRPPRIAYDNLLLKGTVTATHEAAGFEHENAYDGFDWTWFKPGFTGTTYLNVDCATAKPANYVAIYAHNLGANGGTVQLQSSPDNAVWTNRGSLIAPTGTECVYVPFTQASARYWRLVIIGPSTCILGVVSFGVDFALEHGQYVDFASPRLARANMVQNNTSDKGNILGRTILEKSSLITIAIEFMTDAFARSTWLDFWIWAEAKPFFLLWNQDSYSTEAAWGYTDGDFSPVSYTDFPALTKTSVNMRAKLS